MGEMDEFNRQWITERAKAVLEEYYEGITVRQLYYRLVAMGMTNSQRHYNRVKEAMTAARWKGDIKMEAFIDRERSMHGETEADEKELEDEVGKAKSNIKAWMSAYYLSRWSNQKYFIEVWIEKKAQQGIFERTCSRMDVGLGPCKGYPSLTFLNEAKERFENARDNGQEVVILYFGDYDPSGEDIPRSLGENLNRMGCEIEVKHMALNPTQIKEMKLSGVPPKKTDSRTAGWNGGSVVELDAVEPNKMQEICEKAIREHFDEGDYQELKDREAEERKEYQEKLREFVNEMKEE